MMKTVSFMVMLGWVFLTNTATSPIIWVKSLNKIEEVGNGIHTVTNFNDTTLLVSSWKGTFTINPFDTLSSPKLYLKNIPNISCFGQDTQNRLWIANSTKKDTSFIQVIGGVDTTTNKAIFTGEQYVQKIAFDRAQSVIWLGTLQGLYKVFIGEQQLVSEPVKYKGKFPIAEAVHDIVIDHQNYKWIATTKGLYKYGGKERTWQFLPYRGGVRSLTKHNGKIWWASEEGIHTIVVEQTFEKKHINLLTSSKLFDKIKDVIRDITFDKRGFIWIASDRVGAFNPSNPEEIILCAKHSFETKYFNQLTFDRKGNLWISTYDDGLYRVDNDYLDTLRILKKKETSTHNSLKKETTSKPVLATTKQLKKRKVDQVKMLKLDTATVSLEVSDYKHNDGDVVSLYLGNELITKDLLLREKPQTFTIEVPKGEHCLYAVAVDEGAKPSTTTLVKIATETFLLQSNLSKLDMICFTLEE